MKFIGNRELEQIGLKLRIGTQVVFHKHASKSKLA